MNNPPTDQPAATDELMLRARIRIRINLTDLNPTQFEDELADAIRRTVEAHHGTVEQVQVSAGLDPAWAFEGPADRWTERARQREASSYGVFGDDFETRDTSI